MAIGQMFQDANPNVLHTHCMALINTCEKHIFMLMLIYQNITCDKIATN